MQLSGVAVALFKLCLLQPVPAYLSRRAVWGAAAAPARPAIRARQPQRATQLSLFPAPSLVACLRCSTRRIMIFPRPNYYYEDK